MRTTARMPRRLGAGLAVTLLALALGACGQNDESPGVASVGGVAADDTARDMGDPADQARDFARCMREQGVDMEDPGGDGSVSLGMGGDMTDIDDAIGACRQHMPNGGEIAAPSPEQLNALREYAGCMREHGVEMDDPDPSTGLAAQPRGPQDRIDAAAAACDGLLSKINGSDDSRGGDL